MTAKLQSLDDRFERLVALEERSQMIQLQVADALHNQRDLFERQRLVEIAVAEIRAEGKGGATLRNLLISVGSAIIIAALILFITGDKIG